MVQDELCTEVCVLISVSNPGVDNTAFEFVGRVKFDGSGTKALQK